LGQRTSLPRPNPRDLNRRNRPRSTETTMRRTIIRSRRMIRITNRVTGAKRERVRVERASLLNVSGKVWGGILGFAVVVPPYLDRLLSGPILSIHKVPSVPIAEFFFFRPGGSKRPLSSISFAFISSYINLPFICQPFTFRYVGFLELLSCILHSRASVKPAHNVFDLPPPSHLDDNRVV